MTQCTRAETMRAEEHAMNKMQREFLRPSEAAAALGISRSKIYEALATGEIPSAKIAGVRRVPRAWIDEKVREALNDASNV